MPDGISGNGLTFATGNVAGPGETTMIPFLMSLSPGIRVSLQYDCQPPACGVFQGFQGGYVILTEYNGFPGLVRIVANRINAVSPFSGIMAVPVVGTGGAVPKA